MVDATPNERGRDVEVLTGITDGICDTNAKAPRDLQRRA
jgi:hypothetical protein